MERESLEMDVVFVGAGPANLSGAYHLAQLVKKHNEAAAGGKNGSGSGLGQSCRTASAHRPRLYWRRTGKRERGSR